jgi:hypothetical protein
MPAGRPGKCKFFFVLISPPLSVQDDMQACACFVRVERLMTLKQSLDQLLDALPEH